MDTALPILILKEEIDGRPYLIHFCLKSFLEKEDLREFTVLETVVCLEDFSVKSEREKYFTFPGVGQNINHLILTIIYQIKALKFTFNPEKDLTKIHVKWELSRDFLL